MAVSMKGLFVPTLKKLTETSIPSHQLLIRAGLIRQSCQGIYSFLPLGLRSLRKLELIIEDEMSKIDGQRVSLPTLTNSDLWKKSGRWDQAGEELIKVKDRKNAMYCLAPTHEEEITTIVANEAISYRDLPLRLYQIERKFRDEPRPRFGLMRGREFIMKDMYTFDSSVENAMKSYELVCEAYRSLFKRLGIQVVQVEADTGKIGGSLSHEFQLLSPIGEDTILICEHGHYAANTELAESELPNKVESSDSSPLNQEVEFFSPLIDFLLNGKLKMTNSIRVWILRDPSNTKITLVLLPKDRKVNLTKLQKTINFETQEITLDAFQREANLMTELDIYIDNSLKTLLSSNSSPQPFSATILESFNITSNQTPRIQQIIENLKKDRIQRNETWGNYKLSEEGDLCTKCLSESKNTPLKVYKGIELGHAFYLGTTYSSKLGAYFGAKVETGSKGKREVAIMGCFGLGVGRILAGIVEVSHDENGIIWPVSIAPYKLAVIVHNLQDDENVSYGTKIVNTLLRKHKSAFKGEIILDDRKETLKYKLNDAQLIGFPWVIIIGSKFASTGKYELYIRKTKETRFLTEEELLQFFENSPEIALAD